MESTSDSTLLSTIIEDTLLLGLSNSGAHSAVGVSIEFLLEEAFDFDILPNLNLKGATLNNGWSRCLHYFYLKTKKVESLRETSDEEK